MGRIQTRSPDEFDFGEGSLIRDAIGVLPLVHEMLLVLRDFLQVFALKLMLYRELSAWSIISEALIVI